MNDQDFERQLREWMADRGNPSHHDVDQLEAAARDLPPRSSRWQGLRLAGAVVAATVLAGLVVWAGGSLRPPSGAVTPSPEASESSSAAPSSPPVEPTPIVVPGAAPIRDIEPTWSPDGQWIAFTRVNPVGELSVWVMRSDGSEARRLTDGRLASWSPDGRWIAFQHQPVGEHAAVFRIRPDGTRLARLTDGSTDAGGPAWSPDGSTIAYARQESDDDPRILLWLMNADGSSQRPLADVGFDDMAEPAWSPDGYTIAFSSSQDAVVVGREPTPRSIWVVALVGGEPTRTSQMEGVLGSPTWSPDGRWMAWHDEEFGLVIHDMDNISEQATNNLVREPAWSPDGNRIAYSFELSSGAMNIYVATVSDMQELSDIVQLTP